MTKYDISKLKAAEKGKVKGEGFGFVLALLIMLVLGVAGILASLPTIEVVTPQAARQQATRPMPQNLAQDAPVGDDVQSARPQATRPPQRSTQPREVIIVIASPYPTYTLYPTVTAVPPTSTPYPTYTAVPSYTPQATHTPAATYTPYPTATRPALAAVVVTPTPQQGLYGVPWLAVGGGWVLLFVASLAHLFRQANRVPVAPKVTITTPQAPTPEPESAPALSAPVPSTSATSADQELAPVREGQGGRMTLKVTPEEDKFNQEEVDRLCAIYWQLPPKERTQNRLIGEMWGYNEKGEPKKGPGRAAVAGYVIKLCKQQERAKRPIVLNDKHGTREIEV